ncbi:hypothetical protein [Bradyrhizobium sp. JYMT SZCCT0180]|uniref:hypothetical protein n=1 Tax=Bradyrhizobium sp. JYMT SZCCT0180 TaxID=2807666 RepID=UPI001BA6481B|nr:hypothetical protein [Bradyrhizobium sp. JYMT SZCCT0180]MBR1211029.1 hypothetical protein [Bradyrhizobium sp. JYMT SZCCT0180]
MAIAFSRAKPIHITENAGVTREFAYTDRTVMMDPRHDVPFDYSHLHDDLAHLEVLLPPNVAEEFRDPAVLAHALDMTEIRKIWTPVSERIRKPQGAMSVCHRAAARVRSTPGRSYHYCAEDRSPPNQAFVGSTVFCKIQSNLILLN